MAGVIIGAKSVEAVVMPTEKGTSPRQRKLMMLEETPPGQQPTRIRPTAISLESPRPLARKYAENGMMRYCAAAPMKISKGRAASTLKSSRVSVRPMLNIITERIIIWLKPFTQPNICGTKNAIMAAIMTNPAVCDANRCDACFNLSIINPSKNVLYTRTCIYPAMFPIINFMCKLVKLFNKM